MRKLSNDTNHRVCLILALIGLLSGATLVLEPVRLASAQAVDLNWSTTGSLNVTRYNHTATLLPNGKVLVVGGLDTGNIILSSAELYDPTTGTWSRTGNLNTARYVHTATLLPNGKVLVAGGIGGPPYNSVNSAELYDPATGTWSYTGNLNQSRFDHTATLLANGKVLIAVGWDGNSALNKAELYDPVSGTWSLTGNLKQSRYGHTATLLQNGKVLVTGGTDDGDFYFYTFTSAELYDPATGMWSQTADLNTARAGHTATLLANGKVLVDAGYSGRQNYPNSAELYDPATGRWGNTAANLSTARSGHTATLLANGQVLVAGGYNAPNSAELYDQATGTWSSTANLNTAHNGHTATLLANGKILVAGGFGGSTLTESAELYDFGLTQSGTIASVSAASFSLMGLTSEALTTSFGTSLAAATQLATTIPLPTSLAGTIVKVKDSAGTERLAPLFFVSPTQVNYQIPPGTTAGVATVTITSGDGVVSTGVAQINAVAPSLFAANADGRGVAAAVAVRVKADGSQSYEEVAQFDPAQNKFVARPLDLGQEGEQVYLLLFGSGIRHRSSLSAVVATIGSAYAEVGFAGAQPDAVGLDQVNVRLPRSLSGRGEIDVLLTVEAQMANPVRINIK